MGGMKGCLLCCGGSLVVVMLLVSTAVPIASFVISAQNKNETCQVMNLVPLPVWLNVNGAVTLATGTLLWVSFGGLVLFRITPLLIPLILAIVLSSLFTIPWNIIGAISLFRDSMPCQQLAPSLFAMTLASLCFQWWSILTNCCTIGGSSRARGSDF